MDILDTSERSIGVDRGTSAAVDRANDVVDERAGHEHASMLERVDEATRDHAAPDGTMTHATATTGDGAACDRPDRDHDRHGDERG